MQIKAEKICFPKKIADKNLFLILIVVATVIACTPAIRKELPEKSVTPAFPWSLQEYSAFLKENMNYRDEIYSTEYVTCDFVVDTEYSATRIQNLIEPDAFSYIFDNPELKAMTYYEKILYVYEYILREYDFHADPDIHNWQAVEETVNAKKGDCKHLSLLLMSLLLSAGINTHAAISNGHMWVNVYYDNNWHVLEVDNDSERNKIYQIPGFYKNPLYKIFVDHSEKRKKF